MTGLFNKMTTTNLISNILLQSPQGYHALLVVDIDNFKAINDVYGHTVGDHVISIVSNAIISQFNGQELVGRIGGDEFLIFSQNITSKEEVIQKTNALVQIISEKKNLSIPDNVTISIGLAFSDGSEQDFSSLFTKADEALYTSKHAGKSCYSEYGSHTLNSTLSAQKVFVISSSRNVTSMLEFAWESQTEIKLLTEKRDINEGIFQNGTELLASINEMSPITIPVIAICREGCMEQIRLAASYSFISDILFSPLETANLKRRIGEHRK